MNRNRFIRPILLLIVCLIVTYIIWNISNTNANNELRSYFEFRVRDVNTRIHQRLNSYEQILRGVRGLYIVSDNSTVKASVADNGIGITENNVERLFKKEEKVSSKGTDGEPSTGLGLLLCKEFVEMHGGKIWVESKKNLGGTFYFSLPMSIGNENI